MAGIRVRGKANGIWLNGIQSLISLLLPAGGCGKGLIDILYLYKLPLFSPNVHFMLLIHLPYFPLYRITVGWSVGRSVYVYFVKKIEKMKKIFEIDS